MKITSRIFFPILENSLTLQRKNVTYVLNNKVGTRKNSLKSQDSDFFDNNKEALLSIKEKNLIKEVKEEDFYQPKEPMVLCCIPRDHISTYLLLVAISIHSIFEGIALGLLDRNREIFFMLLAVSCHKWVEAISIVNIDYVMII